MGKAVKKITNPIRKGIGALTGTNAAAKAAEEQAAALQAQQLQEAQLAANAARDAAVQTQTKQSTIESQQARDQAITDAAAARKKANETDDSTVDVSVGGNTTDTDEDGRRVNTREKFQSISSSAGLRV